MQRTETPRRVPLRRFRTPLRGRSLGSHDTDEHQIELHRYSRRYVVASPAHDPPDTLGFTCPLPLKPNPEKATATPPSPARSRSRTAGVVMYERSTDRAAVLASHRARSGLDRRAVAADRRDGVPRVCRRPDGVPPVGLGPPGGPSPNSLPLSNVSPRRPGECPAAAPQRRSV